VHDALVGLRVVFHFRVERTDATGATSGPAAVPTGHVLHHYAGWQIAVLTALLVVHLFVATAAAASRRLSVFAGSRARTL